MPKEERGEISILQVSDNIDSSDDGVQLVNLDFLV